MKCKLKVSFSCDCEHTVSFVIVMCLRNFMKNDIWRKDCIIQHAVFTVVFNARETVNTIFLPFQCLLVINMSLRSELSQTLVIDTSPCGIADDIMFVFFQLLSKTMTFSSDTEHYKKDKKSDLIVSLLYLVIYLKEQVSQICLMINLQMINIKYYQSRDTAAIDFCYSF